MSTFQPGRSYGVLHLDDRRETVRVVSRTDACVTLADGRTCSVLHGVAPGGGDEEVLRIGERGPVAYGGVVRVCHLRPGRRRRAGGAA